MGSDGKSRNVRDSDPPPADPTAQSGKRPDGVQPILHRRLERLLPAYPGGASRLGQ